MSKTVITPWTKTPYNTPIQKVYQLRRLYTGLRVACGWNNNFDLRYCSGGYGKLVETVASTAVLNNGVFRVLRYTSNGADPGVAGQPPARHRTGTQQGLKLDSEA